MTAACYLAELDDPRPGQVVPLTGVEARHAITVKRTRMGEQIMLTDGGGLGVLGEVSAIEAHTLWLRVGEVLTQPTCARRWVVVQGLAKGERSDIAVEALTEVGADEIIAWQASRAVVRWEKKADRGVAKWQATAREATKQSRRLRIPQVSYAATGAVAERMSRAALVLVAHESAAREIASVPVPAAGEIMIVIGPEGGISDAELVAFAPHSIPVRISDGVLRTSTAGAVALTQAKLLVDLAASDLQPWGGSGG